MEVIKFLGEKLAEKINISPPAARGLLKLAIQDELGPFTPLHQINLIELIKVFKNALKTRLKNLDIPQVEELIIYLEFELTKNQFLFTMANV